MASNNVEAVYSVAGGVFVELKTAMETLRLRGRAQGRHQHRGERAVRHQRRFDEHNTETGTAAARKRRNRGRGGGKGVQKPEWRSGGGGGRGDGRGGGRGGRGGRGGEGVRVRWSGV